MGPENFYKIPCTDLETKINKYVQHRQHHWSNKKYNKLLEIKSILREWKQNFRKSQREEVISSRLHIGHTRITHSYMLKEEQYPMCHVCQTAYTIKHVLIEYIDLAPTREKYYKKGWMKELLNKLKWTLYCPS